MFKIEVKSEKDYRNAINIAVEYLSNSLPIVFPTETVYGLGAGIDNPKAIKTIYKIKNRDGNKPLAAHISNLYQVEELADSTPNNFYILAEKFLPGPLAVILKKKSGLFDESVCGMDTISFRYPDCELALRIINEYGKPISATSVNISGQPSIIDTNSINEALINSLPLIIDQGITKYKGESTIISLVDEPKILRVGVIPIKDIEMVLNYKLI